MNAKRSGIYSITNTVNGKQYIGSAANLSQRIARHKADLRKGKHCNARLQRAYTKYGEDAFTFTRIIICAPNDLLSFEQLTIDGFDACRKGYNICPVAGSAMGVRRSDATRAKVSAALTGLIRSTVSRAKMSAAKKGVKMGPRSPETIAKIVAANTGRTRSPDARARMSAAKKGRKGHPHSPESRAKISAAHKGFTHTTETRAKISATKKGFDLPRKTEFGILP